MVIGDYSYINQLIDANKNADKMEGFTKVDWDVVTLQYIRKRLKLVVISISAV